MHAARKRGPFRIEVAGGCALSSIHSFLTRPQQHKTSPPFHRLCTRCRCELATSDSRQPPLCHQVIGDTANAAPANALTVWPVALDSKVCRKCGCWSGTVTLESFESAEGCRVAWTSASWLRGDDKTSHVLRTWVLAGVPCCALEAAALRAFMLGALFPTLLSTASNTLVVRVWPNSQVTASQDLLLAA
ncbi:uncharacterized protein M421DRAFT_197889 [Didymella exigua CBS 183.55]|uniref:Uncharacterized protein n=1 Tax=Didymella exigua CBS 183.55 TaxID=1150837 RepID=A0A6A5S2D2_9PLEO|nr:uncharacterized protein M421DRAFT_197889 [Didymella exigua CBS 183.55]KAF1933468.1 hypothetical protein M421DRAFT_197889 [Didymella exigua CBS 183.55]